MTNMPHKCVKCGREYPDTSQEILRGCGWCGSRKFLYVKTGRQHRTQPEEKPVPKTREEEIEKEVLEAEREPTDFFSRVESIRIISPGTYELNIQKLAQSDERVVGYGKEGSYGVDLLSMMKSKRKKKKDEKE